MKTQVTFKRSEHPFIHIIILFTCLIFNLSLLGQTIGLPFGQNASSVLTESWVNGNWQNSSRITNSFDGNNYLIHSLYQEWDVNSGLWVDKIQADYTNNTNGTVNQVIYQALSTSNIWENAQRMTYTYNGANKVATIVSDIWYIGSWRPYSKQTSTYDNRNFLINNLIQNIDLVNGALTNSSQTNFTNLSNGKVDFSITQTWSNGSPGIWTNSQKTIYTYDSNNYLINTLTQKWVASSSTWADDSRDNFKNDSQGNPIEIIDQNVDLTVPGGWVNSSRITITYNHLGVEDFGNGLTISVYPVPAHDKVTISVNNNVQELNYFIVDETGRVFQRGKFDSETTTIDISQLSTGVYFCQIGQGRNQTFKLIKN